MANNQYVNQVAVNGTTIIDLTADTVTPSTLLQGYTAHDASGAAIVGTSTAGTMVIRDTQDSHGGTVREITAGSVVTGTKTITSNGTYDVAEYADASVDVPSAEPELQAKTGITPTESSQTITADTGYDGLSSVGIDAISSTYVGSQVYRRGGEDIAFDEELVLIPEGYYAIELAMEMPSGTEGTPTATKGSVSNHAISVTPSVTNSAGYISGGTHTGTAVSVSASELVSGTYTVIGSGTANVTNYASASVASGELVDSIEYIDDEPSVSVNSNTGIVNVSGGFSADISPISTSGWVDSSQRIPCEVGVLGTYQLSTQAAATITPSTSSQTAVAAGKYTTGAVTVAAMPSGTAGTPTATKGTVSNHSVSVTPSVTNVAGYITGGTKTGTAVTVSASELVSGSETKTANGTYDVTNLASVVVNVSGGSGDDSNFANTISRSGVITSIPSDITTIGPYAFYGCTGLTISSLPSGVTTIGQNAFRGCTGLTISSLPSGVTTLADSVFRGCSSMPLSSLPSGITSVGSYTFADCDLLTVSTLPDGVTYIGASAFQGCPSMTSIQGSGRITTLASSSFLGSSGKPSSLRSAKFPNAVLSSSLSTVFGSTTAANACQQLEEVDVGNVATIAASAFANCYELQTLVLRRTANFTGLANVSAFLNTPMRGYGGLTGTVYVPSALISSYRTASNWSTLYNDGTVAFVAIEGSEYEL